MQGPMLFSGRFLTTYKISYGKDVFFSDGWNGARFYALMFRNTFMLETHNKG
jgi:hypothetical protein